MTAIATIVDGEHGSSVRAKLNALITAYNSGGVGMYLPLDGSVPFTGPLQFNPSVVSTALVSTTSSYYIGAGNNTDLSAATGYGAISFYRNSSSPYSGSVLIAGQTSYGGGGYSNLLIDGNNNRAIFNASDYHRSEEHTSELQ